MENYGDVVMEMDSRASGSYGGPDLPSATESWIRSVTSAWSTSLPLFATSLAFRLSGRPCIRHEVLEPVSMTRIVVSDWAHDDFVVTQEEVTLDQIQQLNALLALPMAEAFSLDLED